MSLLSKKSDNLESNLNLHDKEKQDQKPCIEKYESMYFSLIRRLVEIRIGWYFDKLSLS